MEIKPGEKLTKQEYAKMVKAKEKSEGTNMLKNCACAFAVGGAICTFGQFLTNTYISWGLDKASANTYTTVSLIFLGAFLTGLGVYDKIARHAGAGTVIPITGFANSIVAPAMEFKSEGLVLGMSAKMFTVAGPVLVFGTITSVAYGLVYYIVNYTGV